MPDNRPELRSDRRTRRVFSTSLVTTGVEQKHKPKQVIERHISPYQQDTGNPGYWPCKRMHLCTLISRRQKRGIAAMDHIEVKGYCKLMSKGRANQLLQSALLLNGCYTPLTSRYIGWRRQSAGMWAPAHE